MINQYDLEGHYLKSFSTVMEAAKALGDGKRKYPSIQRACRNALIKNYTAYGFQWRNTKDTSDISPYKKRIRKKKIHQYDKNGLYLRTFQDAEEAGNAMGVSGKTISSACNKKVLTCGFQWRGSYEQTENVSNITPYRKPKKKPVPLTHGGGQPKKSVCQYDFQWNYIKTYDCIRQAMTETKITRCGLLNACRNKSMAGGYRWAFADEAEVPDTSAQNIVHLNQYRTDGTYIRTFASVQEASESVDVQEKHIRMACSGFFAIKGFLWRFSCHTNDIENFSCENHHTKPRQVNRYNVDGCFLCSFKSINEAAESVDVSHASIRKADRIENYLVGGYMWRITDDTSDIEPYIPKSKR